MKLHGNSILITGGSGGIGFELASQLLRRGNEVVVTGRDQAALDSARQKLPGLRTIRSDVRDPNAIATLHQQVMKDLPGMNVLINNAGIMRKINLQTFGTDLQDITEEIEINLSGPIRMVMQFLSHLRAQDRPAIINVSSGLAFNPYPISPIYGAAKAGVHSFTQSLRVQLKHTKIQVFELAPPAVDTPLNHKFVEELKGAPLMSPGKLVEEALKGFERDRMEIRVGLAKLMHLLSRLAPGFILRQLSKPVDGCVLRRRS
jgi:uncharacterized oxidoreductase